MITMISKILSAIFITFAAHEFAIAQTHSPVDRLEKQMDEILTQNKGKISGVAEIAKTTYQNQCKTTNDELYCRLFTQELVALLAADGRPTEALALYNSKINPHGITEDSTINFILQNKKHRKYFHITISGLNYLTNRNNDALSFYMTSMFNNPSREILENLGINKKKISDDIRKNNTTLATEFERFHDEIDSPLRKNTADYWDEKTLMDGLNTHQTPADCERKKNLLISAYAKKIALYKNATTYMEKTKYNDYFINYMKIITSNLESSTKYYVQNIVAICIK